MKYPHTLLLTLLLFLGTRAPAEAQTRCWWEGNIKRCQEVDRRYDWDRDDRYKESYPNDTRRSPQRYPYGYSGNYYPNNSNTYRNYNDRYENNRYTGDLLGRINQYYREVLGRDADRNGLRTYADAVSRGQSLEWVRRDLAGSNEARQAVNQVYQQVLGRNADNGGLDTYTRALQNGWTLAQVRRELIGSPEARYRRF